MTKNDCPGVQDIHVGSSINVCKTQNPSGNCFGGLFKDETVRCTHIYISPTCSGGKDLSALKVLKWKIQMKVKAMPRKGGVFAVCHQSLEDLEWIILLDKGSCSWFAYLGWTTCLPNLFYCAVDLASTVHFGSIMVQVMFAWVLSLELAGNVGLKSWNSCSLHSLKAMLKRCNTPISTFVV